MVWITFSIHHGTYNEVFGASFHHGKKVSHLSNRKKSTSLSLGVKVSMVGNRVSSLQRFLPV